LKKASLSLRSQKRGKVLRNDETSEEKEPSEINWRKEGEIKKLLSVVRTKVLISTNKQ